MLAPSQELFYHKIFEQTIIVKNQNWFFFKYNDLKTAQKCKGAPSTRERNIINKNHKKTRHPDPFSDKTGVLLEMLFSIVISQSTTQGFQEASVWKVQKGNPYSSEHGWSDKKGFRKGSSLDNSVTTLAVRKGRNEDKWSKVQPFLAPKLCIIYPEIVLRSNIRVKIADFRPQILCTESPKGARPVIISRH